MHRMQCTEIWGGTRDHDDDLVSGGVTASLYSRAADGGTGGDIYYVTVCHMDLLTRIALADVTGHGRAVEGTSRWMYETLVAWINRPDSNEVLERLNRLACGEDARAMTTAAIVSFYKADSNLYLSYAGHPPILIRRREAGRWEPANLLARPGPRNLPLGVMAEAPYDQQVMPLTSGNRLFLYTDGVLEARDGRGGLFGAERLLAVLDGVGDGGLPDIKAAVLEGLRRHAGDDLSHDDVTFMAVEIR
ncbi:PP2C family protein-serine/threonine phosphatase [Tautonia plasticadhaerens]|uniref:Stage II sporulation protein E (SpoIIE) n=1 Tax=Tautonia plasticadhaerens TaxID=2527974 RepID=A0A518H4A2_9BACT|nr:PP2C family protein-serine/threonine phosphatase [Tautonia plasticadhaerens]QDV35648.1 Stage II sporulation protein E (SpoIIE) [Tautonia plasticadhaerens]